MALRVWTLGSWATIRSGLESSALQAQLRMLARLIVQVVLAECLLVIYGGICKVVQSISTEAILVEVRLQVCRETRMILWVEVRVQKLVSSGDFHGVDEVNATCRRRLAAFTRGT